jgi:uncharacterized protein (TIGR02594 family)
MFRDYGLVADKDKDGSIQDDCPWCASFVSHSIRSSGKSFPKIASSRKFLGVGSKVSDVSSAKQGDIVVMWNDNPDTGGYSGPGGKGWGGHVSIVIGSVGEELLVVNGNQDDEVRLGLIPKKRILGIRRLD